MIHLILRWHEKLQAEVFGPEKTSFPNKLKCFAMETSCTLELYQKLDEVEAFYCKSVTHVQSRKPLTFAICVKHIMSLLQCESSGLPNECVELMPGSGVYVSLPMLTWALDSSKTGTQLARKLMDMLWDRQTLACSTLTPRASNYHQLDQNTIRAIEGRPEHVCISPISNLLLFMYALCWRFYLSQLYTH